MGKWHNFVLGTWRTFFGSERGWYLTGDRGMRALAHDRAAALAEITKGTVSEKEEGTRVHVEGTYGERPVRIILDVVMARLEAHAKLAFKPDPAFFIFHYYVTTKEEYERNAAQSGVWQESDSADKEFRTYVSTHLCIVGTDDENLKQQEERYQKLPEELRSSMEKLFEQWEGSVYLEEDVLKLNIGKSILGVRGAVDFIREHLKLICKLASAVEEKWK
jgi:hypothetical protein